MKESSAFLCCLMSPGLFSALTCGRSVWLFHRHTVRAGRRGSTCHLRLHSPEAPESTKAAGALPRSAESPSLPVLSIIHKTAVLLGSLRFAEECSEESSLLCLRMSTMASPSLHPLTVLPVRFLVNAVCHTCVAFDARWTL